MRKNRLGLISLLLAFCLVMAGCGASGESKDSAGYMASPGAGYEYAEADDSFYSIGNTVTGETGGAAQDTGALQTDSSRKLITTVDVTAETEQYDGLLSWLSGRITANGGYVEYSELDGGYYSSRRCSFLKIRIPSANLESFLSGLAEESNVVYEARSVKDVTLDYVDVESHKAALKVEQERLMALLEKAEKLEDLLAIEERLTQVRYELESYESQLRTYDNLIDYSTVNLTVNEVKRLTEPEPQSFTERVSAGFRRNLENVKEGLVEFAISFLSSLPVLAVWAVILVLLLFVVSRVRRVWKRRRQKEKEQKQQGQQRQKERKKSGQTDAFEKQDIFEKEEEKKS